MFSFGVLLTFSYLRSEIAKTNINNVNKKNIVIGCLGVLLLSSVAAGYYMRQSNDKRINELETQIGILKEQEKKSVVDRRVSKQMEEIAYGQQALSEERSQEAIRQSEIAQEMTLRSEAERKKALEAQGVAEEMAQDAVDAYQMAERQRVEADNQRQQAEHAKMVADTLNYISLGRTLGSQSYAIYQAGDRELGTMLAYASYMFTNNYGGDLYTSSVFQALTQAAEGRRSWSVHNGSISRIDIMGDNRLLTVSTYGEIFTHRMEGDRMHTSRLMSDKNYCFRDVFAAKGAKAYAISHTGQLVVIDGEKTRVINVENVVKPFSLQGMNDGRQLLIIGENSVAMLDVATDKIVGSRQLGFRVNCTGRRDYKPLLFDNRGRMHLVNSLDDMTNEKVPVSGVVTSFASSKNEHLSAYGMNDGTIWLLDRHGKMYKLVGHLSQITKMKLNGKLLYSSSYDGKLLFWTTGDVQIKPITLFQSSSWLTDFTFSPDKDYIWTGEYNGTISEYLISVPKIANRIRQNVKRNFTKEEWDYYVGKGIPYIKVKE
jgi:hypothetical protein